MTSADSERTRRLVVEQAVEFLGPRSEAQIASFRTRVSKLLSEAEPEALERLVQRVRTTGQAWGYHPPEPLARHIHYAMADVSLTDDSELVGVEQLAAVRDRDLLFVANHISYSDANLFEILLHRFGFDDIAERLTVLAGPKVYSEPLRRFSSLCFGTLKIAQSSARSSGEAVMSPREVARVARQAIALAMERIDAGDALLLFPEGTRSRDGGMQPVLAAAARYCERPETLIVPVGITGTERLIPVGDKHIRPARIVIRVGPSMDVDDLRARCDGRRPAVARALGSAIARQLPPAYRGIYAD